MDILILNNDETPKSPHTLTSTFAIRTSLQHDDHETDNWKCRRIFHCTSKQFEKCITANSCLKSGSALVDNKYKNYVVADPNKWADLDSLRITFDEIVKATNFPIQIRTPKGQHNVLRFDDYKQKLFTFIESRKNGNS